MNGEIILEGMEFYAYHGFFDEEQKIGNKYSVDLKIITDFTAAATTDNLALTVDYQLLYNITKEIMETPARLLEHLAQRIADEIIKLSPTVNEIEVGVSKFNPPIGGVCARSKVIYKSRKHNADQK